MNISNKIQSSSSSPPTCAVLLHLHPLHLSTSFNTPPASTCIHHYSPLTSIYHPCPYKTIHLPYPLPPFLPFPFPPTPSPDHPIQKS